MPEGRARPVAGPPQQRYRRAAAAPLAFVILALSACGGNGDPVELNNKPSYLGAIVTGTSSGSRGVYGAIGSSGEWGLKNGCALA